MRKILNLFLIMMITCTTSFATHNFLENKKVADKQLALAELQLFDNDVDYIRSLYPNFIIFEVEDRVYTGNYFDEDSIYNLTYDASNKKELHKSLKETRDKTEIVHTIDPSKYDTAENVYKNGEIIATDLINIDASKGYRWGTRTFPSEAGYVTAEQFFALKK